MRRQGFWNHELFVCQRSQLVNALRDHLAEYGVNVAQAVVQFRRMIASFDGVAVDLPAQIVSLCQAYIDQIAFFDESIGALGHEIKSQTKTDEATSRLMTVPGVRPMCATTVQAFAPPMEEFSNERDFAF